MTAIAGYLLPALILILVTVCLLKKAATYDRFTIGAKKGLQAAVTVLPNLIGMLAAISLMTASGLTDALITLISPILSLIGVPPPVAPLALLRPLSGSASLAMLESILQQHGADSREGLIASTLMGSSETIFYTVCVYLSATRVKSDRYVIPCSLIGMLAGLIAAALCFPR